MLSVNKLAISVGASTQSATVLPGPIAGVCDSKWHHVAITYGDGSPTAYKQYTDGVLLASNPSVALSVLPAAAAVRASSQADGNARYASARKAKCSST